MNGRASYGDERVTFVADASHPDRFLPQVASSSSSGISSSNIRAFEADDITRVLDFEGIPEPPADGALMYCEDAGTDGLRFPVYHFCLRGGYLFYFDVEDVDEESGPYAAYHNPPLGVVPLEKVTIEFPPGGRRVFREHAHTDARSGYELVILHVPGDDDDDDDDGAGGEAMRPPSFLVAESLGQREKWAKALRARADITKPTSLRAGYFSSSTTTTTAAAAAAAATRGRDAVKAVDNEQAPMTTATTSATTTKSASAMTATAANNEKEKVSLSRKSSALKKRAENKSVQQQVLEVSDDAELANAVVEFGAADFNEVEWMENYFEVHNDFDAPSKCRQMEHFQTDMKKSLKGAVLEQYEYFVQASGEMTTMGKEVASLKDRIELQVDTIKDMKGVDFSGALGDKIIREGGGAAVDDDGSELEPPRLNQPREQKSGGDDRSVFSDVSSIGSSPRGSSGQSDDVDESAGVDNADAPPIEIPDWLDDVAEEIAAVIRECRYNDAIELHIKARNEVADLIEKHERPTAYRLTKKQLADLQSLQKSLDSLGKRISDRLEETLRRKNEALRQASKRERSDPNASVTAVSPCALNDDALYLQLLVKLGKTQVAAEAYSARRTLLLLEALHERPISGAGSVDLVIYAAQLSQSFFSCMANSVEGFLDLFLGSPMNSVSGDKAVEDGDSLADSSLHSHSVKNVPAGAVSSVVLWCDAELAKFASAFGGTRILANLALSPPSSSLRDSPKKPRVVGEADDEGAKERKNAIEVAAQCIDQAFLYASENLDSVGLPLTPRLAEYIRVRLKGCEDEISQLLDERWQHLTVDWKTNGNGHLGMY